MFGHELTVEQGEAAHPHPRHQPGQRHLRRIGAPRHHAFAEKGAAQRHAVEPTHQFLPFPAFDAVGEAEPVQLKIGGLYVMADPGRRAIRHRLSAKRENRAERAIGRYPEAFTPDRPGQRMGQAKAVQRQDRPLFGLHPIDFVRVAIIRHREDADGISLQQEKRVDGHRMTAVEAFARRGNHLLARKVRQIENPRPAGAADGGL